MNYLTAFITAPPDTVKQTAHEGDNWILHHVMDSDFLKLPPLHIGSFTLDMSITYKVFMMMLAAALLILGLTYAARSNQKRAEKNEAPKGLGNAVEALIIWLRDDVIVPAMGHSGVNHLPFLFTVFFFILACNLIGLVPFMSTATGSISITAGLAIITFIMTQVHGIKHNGFFGYFKGLIPPGMPVFVLPVMIIVEFLGLLTKPFALAIRLFANMTAGHIVILSLISLIFTMGYVIIPVSIAFTLFIYVLELLVVFLQAYIFTMLSALFVGMAIHQEH